MSEHLLKPPESQWFLWNPWPRGGPTGQAGIDLDLSIMSQVYLDSKQDEFLVMDLAGNVDVRIYL